MSIPNPYEHEAKLAVTAPELEALAREYWGFGEPLCVALTVVDAAGFADADSTYKAFVALGRELKRCGFVPRLTTAIEHRHRNVSHHSQQRTIYGVYEMMLAAADRDRPRFERAFSAVNADSEAAEHLLGEFRQAGDLLRGWVFQPHARRFHQRAVDLLHEQGISEAFRVAPNGNLLLEDAALKLFRKHLSDEGYATIAVWKGWQDSPSDYGVQVGDDGQPFASPQPPSPPAEQKKPLTLPVWDEESNTLTVGETYTKRFARQAKNVIKLLSAFQKKQWAVKVANPLTQKVLSVVIRDANTSLGEMCPIRFRADGSGKAIIWERVGKLSTTHGNSQEVSSSLA